MGELTPGVYHMKSRIEIHAPVEMCYQAWLDSARLPSIMGRVIDFSYRPKSTRNLDSIGEAQLNEMHSTQDVVPSSAANPKVKHWILAGPDGKLYELESTTVLEIPNRFYCTASTDPKDLSVQSSALFSPDENNRSTLLEWQVSFWASGGTASQLCSDVLTSGDSFMEDCLRDFKAAVENK
jgi:uncharacterized membrane protein